MHETLLNRLRNYYHAHPWFKQLVDQTGHFVGAGLVLAPSVWGHFWASALAIGLVREHAQIQQKMKDLEKSWSAHYQTGTIIFLEPWWGHWGWGRTTDVAFWGVGGLVVSVVAWLT